MNHIAHYEHRCLIHLGVVVLLAWVQPSAAADCSHVLNEANATITSPGVYCLEEDLSFAGTGITVEANDVTIDGQGHTITFCESETEGYGVFVQVGREGTKIMRCTFRAGSAGTPAGKPGYVAVRIRDLSEVYDNRIVIENGHYATAVSASDHNRIHRNIIDMQCRIVGSTTTSSAISVGTGCSITDNYIAAYNADGVDPNDHDTVSNNVFIMTKNGPGYISAVTNWGGGSTIIDGNTICGTNIDGSHDLIGIFLNPEDTLRGRNTVTNNAIYADCEGGLCRGIFGLGYRNAILNNSVTQVGGGGPGMRMRGTAETEIRGNTVRAVTAGLQVGSHWSNIHDVVIRDNHFEGEHFGIYLYEMPEEWARVTIDSGVILGGESALQGVSQIASSIHDNRIACDANCGFESTQLSLAVLGDSGAPVEGCVVTLMDTLRRIAFIAQTDQNGELQRTDVQIKALLAGGEEVDLNPYTLRLQHYDYADTTLEIRLTQSSNEQSITLRARPPSSPIRAGRSRLVRSRCRGAMGDMSAPAFTIRGRRIGARRRNGPGRQTRGILIVKGTGSSHRPRLVLP